MTPELVELIVECVDALKVPAFDPEHRGEHLRRLATAVARPDISPLLHRLLTEESRKIATLEGMHIMDPRPKWIEQVVVALEVELSSGGMPRLLYHGTIRGRLESIQAKSLILGAVPVWKDRKDLRGRSDEAVFFSDTWRGAASWASSAHI